MKKTIYILLLMFASVAFAQHKKEWVDLQIENIQSQFDTKGITEYFIFQLYYPGASYINIINAKCNPYPDSTEYVFWKEGGENWIKRVSECGVSADIQLTEFKPLEFTIENLVSIEKEKVLSYSYKKVKDVNGEAQTFIIQSSHSARRVFKFHLQRRSFIKRIDIFNLTNSEDDKNLNFEYNNSLPIVALSNECHRIVKKLEKRLVFDSIIKID